MGKNPFCFNKKGIVSNITICMIATFTLLSFPLAAQKKIIDVNSINNWPIIDGEKISNNGQYVCYTLSSKSRGSKKILQSTQGTWKREFFGVDKFFFTEDSKRFLYKNKGDSLVILDLISETSEFISNVENFKMPTEGNGGWMAYQLKNGQVVLRNLFNGTDKIYPKADNYLFNSTGSILIVYANSILQWCNLIKDSDHIISHAAGATRFVFDKSGTKLAFISKKCFEGKFVNVLNYFHTTMDSAVVEVTIDSPGMQGKEIFDDGSIRISTGFESVYSTLPCFNNEGSKLLFSIRQSALLTAKDSINSNLQIWSYQDNILIDNGKSKIKEKWDMFTASVNISNARKVIQLDSLGDTGFLAGGNNIDNAIVTRFRGHDQFENRGGGYQDLYFIDIRSGARKFLKRVFQPSIGISLSGNYIIWYDAKAAQYFTYNISKEIIKCITKKIKTPLSLEEDYPDPSEPARILGWLENDLGLLIYDRYDIWKVDPNGLQQPVNITKGYGLKNKTILRYLDINPYRGIPISSNDTLILSGFNTDTKTNMFCKLILKKNELLLGKIDSSIVYFPFKDGINIQGKRDPFYPLKAKYSNVVLFKKMSAKEFPNLYLATDFINFKPITFLTPQKDYNWLTSELIHWKMPNGKQGKGILYKPENFDPQKKYPIIYYYYERNSDGLNLFINPELSQGQISIPFFVSNEYLVFVPDIYYRTGFPGKSSYDAIVSSARFLTTKPWINAKKMGLQGHSYGGFETNYVVGKSGKLFAAAAPASGVTNIISGYGDLIGGSSKHFFYEKRQGRIGKTLWQRPNLYIENSPIFKANKVATPLLIMCGSKDSNVPPSQAIQWFTALRSLQKKVWLLQYADGHGLQDERNQLDYSTRLLQFFDHYLKDKPAPDWMISK